VFSAHGALAYCHDHPSNIPLEAMLDVRRDLPVGEWDVLLRSRRDGAGDRQQQYDGRDVDSS
jgi:hypothetical protein